MCVFSCSVLCDSVTSFDCTAHHAPLSVEFFRQERRSGLPFSSSWDLPYSRVEPATLVSPALAGGFITTSAACEAHSPLKDHLYSAGYITKVRITNLLKQVHSSMFISLNSVGELVNCNAMGVLNCKQYTL